MTYGIDIGSSALQVDWNLIKQNGIEFVIIKATQGDYQVNPHFKELLEGARKAGLITGLYHWCDPLCDGKAQGEYFLEKTSGAAFELAALDFEQHWADWKEWPANIRQILSPAKISEQGRLTASTILNGLGTLPQASASPKQLLIYTRASFIHDYAAPASSWLTGYPLWIAHWAYPAGRVALTWEDLFAQEREHRLEPALPKGTTHWVLHQWSGDRFILPGLGGEKVDLDRFEGSLDALRAWLGLKPSDDQAGLLARLEAQIEEFRQASIGLCEALSEMIGDHQNERLVKDKQHSS